MLTLPTVRTMPFREQTNTLIFISTFHLCTLISSFQLLYSSLHMLDHIILLVCHHTCFVCSMVFLRLYYSVLCAKLLDLSPTHFRLIGKVKLKTNCQLEREGWISTIRFSRTRTSVKKISPRPQRNCLIL